MDLSFFLGYGLQMFQLLPFVLFQLLLKTSDPVIVPGADFCTIIASTPQRCRRRFQHYRQPRRAAGAGAAAAAAAAADAAAAVGVLFCVCL